MTTTRHSTLSDALGIPTLLLALLIGTFALAIVALDEPRPALVVRDDPPAARHYCIEPSTHIIVTERGKHAGGGSC